MDEKCKWCATEHETVCPRVKSIEYFKDGTVKKVEFHGPQPIVFPQTISTPPQPYNPVPVSPQPWKSPTSWPDVQYRSTCHASVR